MRLIGFSSACVISISLLTACSGEGAGAPPAPAAPTSSFHRAFSARIGPNTCPTSKIYVADYGKSDVEVYPQGVNAPAPCRKVKTSVSNPEAVYVDAKGTLYVANYSTSSVMEYAHGGGSPVLTVPTSAAPYDIFVGHDGTLYVAEPALYQVAEYTAGATSPSKTLTISGGAYGVATDNHNNLYVSYLSKIDGVSHVEEFAPGSSTGTNLPFTVPFAGELKLDKANDIIIGDRNDDVIDIFPPGATMPSRTISTAGKPVYLCLDKTETYLYASAQFQVQVFDYQSGNSVNSISSGLQAPSGVAAYPPAPY